MLFWLFATLTKRELSMIIFRLSQKGPLNPLYRSIACDAHLSIAYHMSGAGDGKEDMVQASSLRSLT
jgi:hypothetical protein